MGGICYYDVYSLQVLKRNGRGAGSTRKRRGLGSLNRFLQLGLNFEALIGNLGLSFVPDSKDMWLDHLLSPGCLGRLFCVTGLWIERVISIYIPLFYGVVVTFDVGSHAPFLIYISNGMYYTELTTKSKGSCDCSVTNMVLYILFHQFDLWGSGSAVKPMELMLPQRQ